MVDESPAPETRHRREWRWDVSARVYHHTYLRVAHQVDEDLLAYCVGSLAGATVADCGCGPGIVTAKLLQRGAQRIVAIDANAAMLSRLTALLPAAVADGRVVPVLASLDPDLLPCLAHGTQVADGFRLVLFKRSLYAPPPAAFRILQSAMASLAPGGVTAIVHPARSWRRYALGTTGQPASYTAYHLFNRLASHLGVFLGAGPYTLYSPADLHAMAVAAAGAGRVAWIPTRQSAYLMIALHAPG